ncbi:transketolase [bacterium]|nr:transketolase [bacterium]
MKDKSFLDSRLKAEEIKHLTETAQLCRGDIIKMTTLAGSGHPGGSLSSIDILTTLYSYAKVDPKEPYHPLRDRIIISCGHISPGVYSTLGRLGFINIDDVISGFRNEKTLFEGHVVRDVPGIEWSTGNLGQGLSAGCGFAIASRIKKEDWNVFVVMSDGEQAKGQIAEARKFAKKYNLTNLTVIIDYNQLQISGWIHDVMPQNIKANYEADGWKVLEINGHDYKQIYEALREGAHSKNKLVAIIARTTMGKGISFIENKWEFHGKALNIEQYKQAIKELGLVDDLTKYSKRREKIHPLLPGKRPEEKIDIDVGTPFIYGPEEKTDNRSAFGKALADIGKRNFPARFAAGGQIGRNVPGKNPLVVLDCDLSTSVKTASFANNCSCNFLQGGVQEHNTATVAGALSTEGIVTFFADFGVFGIDETYNQHRLNDINNSNLKLMCTHCGLDVGEDGKTHQCIDYIGAMRNLFGFKIIVPADPNQTDRAVRYIAKKRGNFIVAMGRSKLPIVLAEDCSPLFGGKYEFQYGKADILRDGNDASIITCGAISEKAIKVSDSLKTKGYSVRVVNISCPSDIDKDAIRQAVNTGLIVTLEDHHKETGLGSIVAQVIAEESLVVKFVKIGVDHYGESGKPEELYKLFGMDEAGITQTVLSNLKK